MNKLLKSFAFRALPQATALAEFGCYRDIFIVQLCEQKAVDLIRGIDEVRHIINLRHNNLYLLELVSRKMFAKKLAKLLIANNVKIMEAYLNVGYVR